MLPLTKVTLPANARIFFESIFQIAAFDFYDLNDFWHEKLNIEPTEPFNDNFNELGFESRYMLNNMGTMFFFILLYPVLYTLQRLISLCKKCNKPADRTHRKLKKMLFYRLPITVMIESYGILAICCLLALPVIDFTSSGLAVQSSICLFFLIFILTVPYYLIRYVIKRHKNLD